MLRLILDAVTDRYLRFLPFIVTAAYDEPPSATKTAIVDITFA